MSPTLSNLRDLLQRKQPLSGFGIVLTLGGFYLTWGPGLSNADLVAQTIGVATLFLVGLAFAAVSVSGYLNRKNIALSFYPPAERSTSQSSQRCFLNLTAGYLLPLCNLNIQAKFEHQLNTTVHELRGLGRTEARLAEEITFPHRGEWEIHHAEISVGDLFGICSLKWRQSLSAVASARVFPPQTSIEKAEIITSSFREGDTTLSEDVRVGDPFDLKQYHPSDGLRKILWKIYAKSGELIARHPEPSMTPEGLLYSFAFCDSSDDALAGSAVAYLALAESMNITLRFGCSGMKAAIDSGSIAHTASESESLLVESVWNQPADHASALSDDLEFFLKEAARESAGLTPVRILLFVSARRFATTARAAQVILAGTTLEQRGIKPVFYLFDSSSRGSQPQAVAQSIKAFFIETEPSQAVVAQSQINKFLGDCSRAQWDVIV